MEISPTSRLDFGLNTFLSIPFSWLFLGFPLVQAVTCAQQQTWRDHMQISRAFILCSSCFFGTLPHDLWLPLLPRHPVPSLQLREFLSSAWAPSLYAPDISSRQLAGQHSAHLICFPSLKERCPLLPDVPCPEYHCFISFVWHFSCFRSECKFSLPSPHLDWKWGDFLMTCSKLIRL